MKSNFEERWKRAIEKASARFKNDKSLKELIKRHDKMIKRLEQIEVGVTKRRNKIFMEELKKEFAD